MSTLPNIPSNKKCWRYLNKIVFGESVCCPVCQQLLKENYRRQYLWCSVCRKKYRATSYKGSWLYGMKLTTRQLLLLLWCWQNRKSTETALLAAHVTYPTLTRWYDRFRRHLPDALPLLEGVIKADESYFGKKRSHQPQLVVTGAVESHTGRKALRITGTGHAGRDRSVLEQFITDVVKPGSHVVTDKWYGYDELPLLGYTHESHNHSKGDYADTNEAENIWSVSKRHMRKLGGGRLLTKRLEDFCREWMARANQPELFIDPLTFLRFTLFRVS